MTKSSSNPMLPAHLSIAEESASRALTDIAALQQAAATAQASIQAALQQARRSAKLAGEFEPSALQEFVVKPYLVHPIAHGKYELIVPRFIGFRAGWPVRQDGSYSVYEVSRFTHMLNPLPDWLASELGYTRPTWTGSLEGNTLTVTEGDASAVAEKLGKAISRREGNRLYLKAANRFDVLRRIIREEGFLPYTPAPLPAEMFRAPLLKADETEPLELRPHQQASFDVFKRMGAVSIVAYMQTGKSYLPLWAFATLKGKKLILCYRRTVRDQWQERIERYLTPEAAKEVVVGTYHAAEKYLKDSYSLVVFDEGHHVPANFALEAAANANTASRMLLSASPFREDGNDDLIIALGGWPVGMDWPVSHVQKPRVQTLILADESAKLREIVRLCQIPVDGKTMIFTWRLEFGQRIADKLGVPFVNAKTRKALDVIRENDTVVLSSVGDEGLSIPMARGIDADALFGSRNQTIQRYGRGAYERGQKHAGVHYILMTPHEYNEYGKRLWAFERYGVEVTIDDLTASATPRTKTAPAAPRPRLPLSPRNRRGEPEGVQPRDEIAQLLALPSVASRIKHAKDEVGVRTAPYVAPVFRILYAATFSPEELTLGKGIRDTATISRYRSACKALKTSGLLVESGQDAQGNVRYTVNKDEVNRLKALAHALKQ